MLIIGLATGLPNVTTQSLIKTLVLPWFSGVFEAIFILTATFMIPRFGAARAITLVVWGQIVGAMTLDHLEWFGLTQQPISTSKVHRCCDAFGWSSTDP